MRSSHDLVPLEVFRLPRFNSSLYLQRHLVHPGVNVSDLHPIMRLRLAALMIDLTRSGFASDVPGQGQIQIVSGVRTQAQQIALYQDICLRQGRCSMVANPYHARSSGADAEGVLRHGSNHMAQRQSGLWAAAWGRSSIEVGHAVDFRTTSSWEPLHSRLRRYGLDWPLRGSPYEPWHVEAFPDRSQHRHGWVPGPWPKRPGVHRPLYVGCRGGDVGRLQVMAGIDRDGSFGPATRKAVRRLQRRVGTDATGVWATHDQRRWERWRKTQRPHRR